MTSIKRKSYRELIIYLFLFLIGFNFLGKAVFGIYLLALFMFLFVNNDLKVPKSFFIVIILCAGILASQLINGIDITFFSLLKLGVYPIVYLIFYKIAGYEARINGEKDVTLEVFFYMMFFFELGNMAHMIADISITDLSKINMGRRILNDVWSKGTVPTTIIVGWGCINMPMVLYAFEQRKTKRIVFITSLVMMIIYMFFSFVVATRLGIVNALLTLVFFVFKLIRDKEINLSFNTLIKLLGLILIFVFVGIKITPYVLSSNLYLRLTSDSLGLFDSNGRSDATIYLLQNFDEAIWGGEYFTKQYGLQQHNILFQMYDLYGLLPFICFGIVIFNSIRYTVRVTNSFCFCNPEKRFVLLFFVSFMLYCFEEPAISSNYVITSMIFGYLGYMRFISRFTNELGCG